MLELLILITNILLLGIYAELKDWDARLKYQAKKLKQRLTKFKYKIKRLMK